MFPNNSRKPKKEFTPSNWKEPSPFKKSSKFKYALPIYSIEELQLLSKYFEDSAKNRAFQNRVQPSNAIIGISNIFIGNTISGRFQSSSQNPTPYRECIDYENFKDLPSFHRMLKKDPNWVIPFKIPFSNLPLHVGKEPTIYYRKYWYTSVISWRLQIGK